MMLRILFLLALFVNCNAVTSQTPLDTVVAQQGDGIFSMLRNAGIHPVNYYVQFLELNKQYIKGASELVIGKPYLLPHAPDSFKNMGTYIAVDTGEEMPIFDTELPNLKYRDSTLKNTVYYLVYQKMGKSINSLSSLEKPALKFAKTLMEKGARVYILQHNQMASASVEVENFAESRIATYGSMSSIINNKALKHNASYQRALLVWDANENAKQLNICVGYHETSAEGKLLAEELTATFAKSKADKELSMAVLKDRPSLYLAKNLVPPLSLMVTESDSVGLKIAPKKLTLSEVLSAAVAADYKQHSKVN